MKRNPLAVMIAAFVLMIAFGIMFGCSGRVAPGESGALETLYVFGVMRAIEESEDPVSKAHRYQRIVDGIERELDMAGDGGLRAAVIRRLIQETVGAGDLRPSEQYLVSQADPIIQRFTGGDSVIVGARLEAFRLFLHDVRTATLIYSH